MEFNVFNWREKQIEFFYKYGANFHSNKMSEKEKILYVLKDLELNIHPYSFNGRSGYKKYLKKAIKIIKEEHND